MELNVMGYHENYLVWANEADLDASLKGEVAALANDAEAQEEAFAVPMAFGTAGMRGVIGAGINRMNIYTVRQATEGLANFMDACRN
jgi:phosphoglucomutase